MKRLHISKKNLVLFYDKHFAKIVFVIAFVCMILLYPNVGKFKYAYRSGTPWMYETLMAPFDFPIPSTVGINVSVACEVAVFAEA